MVRIIVSPCKNCNRWQSRYWSRCKVVRWALGEVPSQLQVWSSREHSKYDKCHNAVGWKYRVGLRHQDLGFAVHSWVLRLGILIEKCLRKRWLLAQNTWRYRHTYNTWTAPRHPRPSYFWPSLWRCCLTTWNPRASPSASPSLWSHSRRLWSDKGRRDHLCQCFNMHLALQAHAGTVRLWHHSNIRNEGKSTQVKRRRNGSDQRGWLESCGWANSGSSYLQNAAPWGILSCDKQCWRSATALEGPRP